MHFKTSSAKRQPFCLGLNALMNKSAKIKNLEWNVVRLCLVGWLYIVYNFPSQMCENYLVKIKPIQQILDTAEITTE